MNRMIEVNELGFEDLIDSRFPFRQAGDALENLWSGKHVGKVIIEIP